MNIDNLRLLRDTLVTERAKGKEAVMGFNMVDLSRSVSEGYTDHLNTCGTVSCLAGWSFAIAHPEYADERGFVRVPSFMGGPIKYLDGKEYDAHKAGDEAGEWLGFEKEEADELFRFQDSVYRLADVTLDDALEHLNDMLTQGGYLAWGHKPVVEAV